MPYDDVQKFAGAAKAKAALLKDHPWKYFLRAVMAGFFIAVAMIYSNVVGNLFKDSDPAWGKFLGALVFSIAVLLIVFIGSELFTGNNLVMGFASYGKDVPWKDTWKIWGVSYVGNFVGCVIFALIFVASGASGTKDYFAGIVPGKLALPMDQMFFKAVLCNFFVCLAVACGLKCKEEAAKFFMIVICISGFVVSGFEHSIANMAIYTTAAALGVDMSVADVLKSMLIVTVGNMVGGGLLLAWPLRKMSADK